MKQLVRRRAIRKKSHRHSCVLASHPATSSAPPAHVHDAARCSLHRCHTSPFASSCFCSATCCKNVQKIKSDAALRRSEARKQRSRFHTLQPLSRKSLSPPAFMKTAQLLRAVVVSTPWRGAPAVIAKRKKGQSACSGGEFRFKKKKAIPKIDIP